MNEQNWRVKLAEECQHYAQETRCMMEAAKDIDEALKDEADPAYIDDLTTEYGTWHRQRNDTRAAIQKLVKEIDGDQFENFVALILEHADRPL